LDFYCAGFANAYDLTIAGRCRGTDAPPASRAEPYDRYIRKSVPQHASVVSALMRRLTATMGDAYALALGRNALTRTAEAVTEGCQAPLGILDDRPRMRFARLSEKSSRVECVSGCVLISVAELSRGRPRSNAEVGPLM
jgi:hypothetical protein